MNAKLPISETFHSIQGEGVHVGVPMHFVRLAGCNVGQYDTGASLEVTHMKESDFKLYQEKRHSVCFPLAGKAFLCDTDYHKSGEMAPDEIVDQTWEEHICLTGGEPFLHDLVPLWQTICGSGKTIMLHIETSGTRDITPFAHGASWWGRRLWITCSPKLVSNSFLYSNLQYFNEVKLLVGPDFNEGAAISFCGALPKGIPINIQPINPIDSVDQEAVERCLQLLAKHPHWRLSVQLHKFIHQR